MQNSQEQIRLDKFLCNCLAVSRNDAGKLVRAKRIKVNGELITNANTKIFVSDKVEFDEELITPNSLTYNFLVYYKPEGFVCAHNDLYSVYDQLPVEYRKFHSVGRLDKDTTGLLFLTNDGAVSHWLTSPKHKVGKTYRVWLADAVEDYYVQEFANGIMLRGNKELTLPAQLDIIDDFCCDLTIYEGQYHQVKRMFAALGNKVEALHRWKIGNYELPQNLEKGEFIEMTAQEALDLIIGK